MNSLPQDLVRLLLKQLDLPELAAFLRTCKTVLGAMTPKLFEKLESLPSFQVSTYEFELLTRKLVDRDGRVLILGLCFGRAWNHQKENWEYRFYKGGRVFDVTETGSISQIFGRSNNFEQYTKFDVSDYSRHNWDYLLHHKILTANIYANRLSLMKQDPLYYNSITKFDSKNPDFYTIVIWYAGSVDELGIPKLWFPCNIWSRSIDAYLCRLT